jgi:hypothetical protein
LALLIAPGKVIDPPLSLCVHFAYNVAFSLNVYAVEAERFVPVPLLLVFHPPNEYERVLVAVCVAGVLDPPFALYDTLYEYTVVLALDIAPLNVIDGFEVRAVELLDDQIAYIVVLLDGV